MQGEDFVEPNAGQQAGERPHRSRAVGRGCSRSSLHHLRPSVATLVVPVIGVLTVAHILVIEPQPERKTELLRPIEPSHRGGQIVVIEERWGLAQR